MIALEPYAAIKRTLREAAAAVDAGELTRADELIRSSGGTRQDLHHLLGPARVAALRSWRAAALARTIAELKLQAVSS